jgi:hypothetical protein
MKVKIVNISHIFYKVVEISLYIAILFFTLRAVINLGTLFLSLTRSPNQSSEFDVVATCQKIASQATNEHWGYNSCIEELSKTIRQGKIISL